MERNEVSSHEILVFRTLSAQWITSKEVAERTGVAARTARAHLLKLVKLGIADQAEVFPAHRYRLCAHASQRNRGYAQRLEHAADALGIPLP
jgi:predicted ArsR family transcriptional regulator